jgi:uridine kinase
VIEPLISKINGLLQQKESVIVGIDGNSGAGKSTLAAKLEEIYSASVIHMDDFFLRPEQRTPERLGEPGGNIDYERFCAEVIEPLRRVKAFTYRPYDCRTGGLSAPVTVTPRPLTVIEGVYSLHPRFIEIYDFTVFLSIDQAEQHRRLAARNPRLLDRFINEWLPMEKIYFDTFKPQESTKRTGLPHYTLSAL